MKVIVACEFSGVVRDAFLRWGHDAISCDILPSLTEGPHIQGDIRSVDLSRFDLMIAHPPCTDLAVSGERHFHPRYDDAGNVVSVGKIADGRQGWALDFVRWLMDAPVERIAIENPISVISSQVRKPDQVIQPYQFGHPTTKATCLWLKNLPKLTPTDIVEPEYGYTKTGKKYDKWWLWTSSLPHPQREHERSKTFQGIAEAMAEQWS